MAIRTVRLDAEAESALREIRDATGLPVSEAIKRGLRALLASVRHESARTAYDIYQALDHGPGGSALASSDDTTRAVRAAIRKKLGR